MSTKMLVTMKLDQRLMMSQQLRQAITLLQYNTLDLKQLIQQYIDTNPLIELEEHEVDTKSQEEQEYFENSDSSSETSQNFSAEYSKKSYQSYEDESALENYAIPKTLRNYLLEQTLLCQFNPESQLIAETIIDVINDDGYLSMSFEDICKLLPQVENPEEVQKVLNKIQTFDPIGIGSRDLQECLLIQLNYCVEKDNTWNIAYKILHDNFDLLSAGDAKKIMKMMKLTSEEYQKAIELIRTFNARPGMQYSSEMNVNIEPELYVKKVKNQWRVYLSESILTNIKINRQYQEIIKQNKKHGSYQALKQELEEAKNLLKGLKKRNETLFAVAKYIVEFQQDFLEKGAGFMKPMNIVDVSQALNVHESTVSRVTSGKYIVTPKGVFELKYFFPSHVTTQAGDMCSAVAVKLHDYRNKCMPICISLAT